MPNRRPKAVDQATDQSQLLEELEAIKKILMHLAIKIGTSSNELGAALNVSGQRIRQTVPASEIKKLRLESVAGVDER